MKNVFRIQQERMPKNKKNKHLFAKMNVPIHSKLKDTICMKWCRIRRNINTIGKWLILTILIVFLVLLILAISIFIYRDTFNSIHLISLVITMIVLLIVITFLLNKLKLNYYILYWHLKPSLIDQRTVINHDKIELSDLLPFILSDRDSIIYTKETKEED